MERLPLTGRAVVAYGGCLLPGYLHTIRIEHLRPLPGEKYLPFRVDNTKTHHLWILCRPSEKNAISVVVSIQFAIYVPTDNGSTMDLWQAPDRIAAQIGKFLAEIIAPSIVTGLRDPRLLRRIPDQRTEKKFAPFREEFWTLAIEKKLADARKDYQ